MLTKLTSVVGAKLRISALTGGKLYFSLVVKAIISLMLTFSINIKDSKAKKP